MSWKSSARTRRRSKSTNEISKLVLPLFKRLDNTTATMLLPSLADEQSGFVIDAKWKSKQWHAALPTGDRALPMLELAFLVGVSDHVLLEKAMKSYGKLIEDALVVVKENAPQEAQPPFAKLPQPQMKAGPSGKVYHWGLPQEWMLDRRIALTAGLSEKVGLITLSSEHAERLLASKPLKVEGGPLADRKRLLTGASYINWSGLVDSLSPWLLFALEHAHLEQALPGGEDEKNNADAQKKQGQEIVRHTRALLDALKAIRLSTSATYIQDGALITHSETILRDE